MSKRHNGSQLDLDLTAKAEGCEFRAQNTGGRIMPFVDSATLQVRRDALRRVAANGIFRVPPLHGK